MPTSEQLAERLDELRRRGVAPTRPLTRTRLVDALLDHRLAVRQLNGERGQLNRV